MGGRAVIGLGLVAGVVAGALLVGGVVALAPGARPTASPVTPAPTDAPAASAIPGASADAPSGSADPSASASPGTGLVVGLQAPALVVPQFAGGTIDLAVLRGRPVWVDFIATTCRTCMDQLSLLAGFVTRYADESLVVIVVDVRENEAAVAAAMTAEGVTLPVGLDANGAAQQAWGAGLPPVHVWIDRDGIVRHVAAGAIDAAEMASGLGSILPGVVVTP